MPNQNQVDDKKAEVAKDAKQAFSKAGKPFGLYSTLPYYSNSILYAISYYFVEYHDNPYIPLACIFLLTSAVDAILPLDWLNPTQEQARELERNPWFRVPLHFLIGLDFAFLFYTLNKLTYQELPLFTAIGIAALCGLHMGATLACNHELQHKRTFDKYVAMASLAKNCYLHYHIEHNWGHHRHVATPEDPTTGRYGESFYAYLVRSLREVYVNAWRLEKEVKGRKSYLFIDNRMIWFTLYYFFALYCVGYCYGVKTLGFYILMLVSSYTLMASAEFCEHYALARKKIGDDSYELVNITHSWNAPQRFSNYFLIKVQRHSDHHENGYKPYQVLLSLDESPQLTHGYTFCALMCLNPPLFRDVMHTKLKAFQENNRPLRKEEEDRVNRATTLIWVTNSVLFGALIALNHFLGH